MTDWWANDPVVQPSAGGNSGNWWQNDPVVSHEPSWSDVGRQALKNAPESAWRFAKDAMQPFLHPIATAEGVKNIAEGVGQKLGLVSGHDDEKFADAAGGYFKDRYGSIDGFKRAVASDPVGVLGDLSTVLTAGGGALARAPGLAGKAAEIAGVVGDIANPVRSAAKAASAVAGPAMSVAAYPLNMMRGFANPDAEASRRVATMLDRDLSSGRAGLSPQEFSAAKNAGTPVSLMDIGGKGTQGLARSAANTSPEARGVLDQMVEGRFHTQGDRITDWLNSTFNYPDAVSTQRALADVAKNVNRPAYAKAYSEGAKGIWDEGFEQISQAPVVQDAIRKAMVSARNESALQGFTPPKTPFEFDQNGRLTLKKDAEGNRMLPSLQFWDVVKKNLDKVGTRESKEWSRILRDQLDEKIPSYATARAGAATFFGAQDALEAGQQAVTSRMKNREMAEGLAKMSPGERKLFQDGFVDRYVQMIREVPDRRSVLNQISSSPAARQRLLLALGPQKADELEAMLRVETVMDGARGAVQGNSSTARQMAELGLAGGMKFPTDKYALFHSILMAGKRKIDGRVAEKVAKLLASDNAEEFAKGLRVVSKNPSIMDAIRNAKVVGRAALISRDVSAYMPSPTIDIVPLQ